MADPFLGVEVQGLDALAAGLKSAEKDLAKEQRKAHKQVAEKVAAWASSAARGGTRQQAAAAGQIKPRGTNKSARLAIVRSSAVPFASAAFWGMKGRSGWYAQAKYADSTGRQAPPWVGNTWIAGRRGEGPYVLNDTIAGNVERIEAMYAEAADRALSAAFPGR